MTIDRMPNDGQKSAKRHRKAVEDHTWRLTSGLEAAGATSLLIRVGNRVAQRMLTRRTLVQRYTGPEHQDLGDKNLQDLYEFMKTKAGQEWARSFGYDPAALLSQLEQDPMRKGEKIRVRSGLELSPGEVISLMGDFYGTWQELASARQGEIRGTGGQQGILDVMEGKRAGTISDADERYGKITRGRYLELAKKNETHFARLNRAEWKRLHLEAIQKATEAAADGKEETFQKALLIDAAAGHFLTDVFAAGHLFDRSRLEIEIIRYLQHNPIQAENPEMQTMMFVIQQSGNLGNVILKNIHDRMNVEGFEVANARGMPWRTFGDSRLKNAEETRRIASLAVFLSRQQIYAARDGDSPDPDDVLELLPDDNSTERATEQAIVYIPEAVRQIEPLIYRKRGMAKSQFGSALGWLVEANLESIASPGRIRQLEEMLQSAERAGEEKIVVPALTIASWE